jgi:hypothetical protein
MDELRIKINRGTIWIDGNHPVFKNTEFAGKKFRIRIEPLTRTEIRKIREEIEQEAGWKKDQDAYFAKICERRITGWEIQDEKGNPIPYGEQAKMNLIENFPNFTNLIAAACIAAQAREQENDEEDIKNLSPSGSGGPKTEEKTPGTAKGARTPAGRKTD